MIDVTKEPFFAPANGYSHPLRWTFGDGPDGLKKAQEVFPFVTSLDVEHDTAAIQGALNRAKSYIQQTLARGPGDAINRTGSSYSPPVFLPAGRYMINQPLVMYPHTSLIGVDWGHSQLQWVDTLKFQGCAANPQGVMWAGKISTLPCLLWLQGDEEYPPGSGLRVAGMCNTVRGVCFKNHAGPAIFIPTNQNQLRIADNWINGWGDGPTGFGIIANNATSSTQITNLFMHGNFIEGCRAAVVMDRVMIGSIHDNQIDSCQYGIYLGSGDPASAHHNLITNSIPQKPLKAGIWIGTSIDSEISHNTIQDIEVEESAIKFLGQNTTTIANRIRVKNGGKVTASGYGVKIVGPSKQFGGNVAEIKGYNGSHTIANNSIYCDVWPDKSKAPILIDQGPGEVIHAAEAGNITSKG